MRALRNLALRILLAAGLCLSAAGQAVAADVYDQDAVKAAFLYRFSGFVEWPVSKPPPRNFTIAVLGADAVAGELGKLLSKHAILGVPARVLRIQRIDELDGAQMLYVGSSSTRDLRRITAALRGKPVLVVADTGHGLDDGAAINFMMSERRVRFEISLTAAERAGLKLGAGLLAVAVRVRGGPQSELLQCPQDAPPGNSAPACPPLLASL